MNDDDLAMIPYFVHEGEMARSERTNKRLWVIIIILIVCLVGSNAGWLIYESQFADEVTTIEQDSANGTNNFIGHDGDISYGEATDNNQKESSEDGR